MRLSTMLREKSEGKPLIMLEVLAHLPYGDRVLGVEERAPEAWVRLLPAEPRGTQVPGSLARCGSFDPHGNTASARVEGPAGEPPRRWWRYRWHPFRDLHKTTRPFPRG